jgi:hypothetical protein
MSKRFALYHSVYLPRRCEIFIGLLAISASFCLPAIAQEHMGWQSDSLPANSTASVVDTQQVYGILLKMLDRWNAHDIEGYMEVFGIQKKKRQPARKPTQDTGPLPTGWIICEQ